MNKSKFYMTIIFLWLSHFLVDFMIGIWPIYKTIAGLDIATMGLIAGVSVFTCEAMQLYFGALSDRGHQKILIISGLLLTSACGLISYTQNYLYLFILFFITCLGSGAFHPSAVGLVGSLSEHKKGVLITLFAMGGAIGFAFSQLVFSNFYLTFDGQTAYLMIPTSLLALSMLFYSFANKPKEKVAKKPINIKSIVALFKKEHLSTLYFTQFCNQIIGWGTIFLLPDILCSRGASSWICYGGGHLFLVLGGAFMMVPSGYLADRFSYKKVIIAAKISGMFFFILFLKFPFIPTEFLLPLLFLMGTSIMVINPLVIAFGNKLYPNEPGAISGFLMGFAWFIASPLGQAGGGLLTRLFTEDAAAKSLSCLSVFFVVGLFISFYLPETNRSTQTEPEFGL